MRRREHPSHPFAFNLCDIIVTVMAVWRKRFPSGFYDFKKSFHCGRNAAPDRDEKKRMRTLERIVKTSFYGKPNSFASLIVTFASSRRNMINAIRRKLCRRTEELYEFVTLHLNSSPAAYFFSAKLFLHDENFVQFAQSS